MYESPKFLRRPIDYEINGLKCRLLSVGHVGHALGRSTWTVRYWTRLGLLPEPAFHLSPGNPKAHRTLYPEPYVIALAKIIDQGHVGPRLDRGQWRGFQLDAWAAYQETVVPLLIGGVVDGGLVDASTDTDRQVLSSTG